MALAGLCTVCQRPGAYQTCPLCGRLVCHEHYGAGAGACSICRGGRV